MREERRNDDRIERVLSAQQWQVLRALLDESAMSADPILRKGETLGSGEYLTICYELHHVLLPELADMRLVEFDRFKDKVRRGRRFDEGRRFLEQIADDHDK
ncbi:hypothetical protein C476_00487 [Natrinema limicola JCM 13563]|uniref:Transcriptional regulator n=1 Tax=Natrinema limicola JCM 13563 TaxID=1230457 RepID=M0CTZ9_9EURY|nr:hypothetical protein C476_00487 [Natrinema limicola JCM 13563]